MLFMKTTNAILLFFMWLVLVMGSCSKEVLIPEPPPPPPPIEEVDSLVISPKFRVLSYSDKADRFGGGDFSRDTLFLLSNIPDGSWEYTLKLGGEIQVGRVEVVDEQAKIANNHRVETWLECVTDDSITLYMTLYSEDYIMTEHTDSFSFVNEMYLIRSWQDLQAMCYDPMGSYSLKNDITFPEPATEGFPEQGFVPVGTAGPSAAFLLNAFKGSLNGYGYKIKNFSIDRADLNYVGLFGVIADANIKDLYLEISSSGIRGGSYVGAIAGYVARKSVIENCKVIGNVSGLNQVGGIAGEIEMHSAITLSRTTGGVEGKNYVGGIVGTAREGSSVSTSFVEGKINGNDYLGGLVGHNKSILDNSQAGGEINSIEISGGNFIGGLCGYNNGEILGCRVINAGIEGKNDIGGLTGFADTLSVHRESCSKAGVNGEIRVGGMIGSNHGKISNSYVIGKVEGQSYVGGLVGDFYSEVTNSYASADVSGTSLVSSGSFMGINNGSMISCYYDNERSTLSRPTGNNRDFGLEAKDKNAFISFSALQIPREIFTQWDFESIWENEVPLAGNEQLPGLKREFNFE
jgi:hypothetical protein